MNAELLNSLGKLLGGAQQNGAITGGNDQAVGKQIQGAQATDALARDASQPSLSGFFKDYNAMAQVFGMLGQALSARDPKSWQYQLGAGAQKLGVSGSAKGLNNSLAIRQASQLPPQGAALPINAQESPQSLPASDLGALSLLGDAPKLRFQDLRVSPR